MTLFQFVYENNKSPMRKYKLFANHRAVWITQPQNTS